MYRTTQKIGQVGNPNEFPNPYPNVPTGGGGTVIIQPPIYYPIPPDNPTGFPTWHTPQPYIIPTDNTPVILTTGNTNNTNMSKPNLADCQCLTGNPFLDANGVCRCSDGGANNTPVILTSYPIPQNGTPPTSTTVQVQLQQVSDKIKANPLLAVGAAIAIGFLIFKK